MKGKRGANCSLKIRSEFSSSCRVLSLSGAQLGEGWGVGLFRSEQLGGSGALMEIWFCGGVIQDPML